MSLSTRRRIICFRVAIKDDFAMMGSLRLGPMQRYYHSRHSGDFLFAADYNLPRLAGHLGGSSCEIIDITVHKAEPYIPIKKALGAFSDALLLRSFLPRSLLRQEGFSGQLYRAFMNNYFRLTPGYRYLELGAHDGSAFAAALHGNSLDALAVDDWESKEDARRRFMNNLMCVSSPASRFGMLDKKLGGAAPEALGRRGALLFHGAFAPSAPMLEEILDSGPDMPALAAATGWNFAWRRTAWQNALEECTGLEPCLSISVRTSLDEHADGAAKSQRWADGCCISLLTGKA